jgi:predicted aldo/keto reductase-like oxidoreductase
MTAVNDGRFDVILLAYNFVNADKAERILEACEKKGIATMIMKSNPVYLFNYFESTVNKLESDGKEADAATIAIYEKYKKMNAQAQGFFSKYGIKGEEDLKKAATKYVLSNPKAHTTLWNFGNFTDVENILQLSGQKLTKTDLALLNGYHKNLGHTACRIGCNDCEAACPNNIPVNKILRYNYYFNVKKQEKMAMSKYARLNLPDPASQCISCEGYCEKACKYGVWTQPLIASARQSLEIIA